MQMPEKNLTTWASVAEALTSVIPWVHTLILSIVATAAQYAAKVRAGEPFAWKSIVLDAVICVFVGLLTHMICEWQGLDGWGRSVLVAISAHMGTRAMALYEQWRDRIFGFRGPTP